MKRDDKPDAVAGHRLAEATGNDFLEHLRDEISRSCG
jgi:hypothetical protein